MTWDELKAHIEMMDKEQRQTDVTIRNISIDEYFAVQDIGFSPDNDVLDKNHPFLVFNVETSLGAGSLYHKGIIK